jgi:DNA-binding Lrp family transcriptional regulator
MDQLDRRMIGMMRKEPRITYRAMSDRLGTSVPNVYRRIERLRTSGTLGPIRTSIRPEAVGGTSVLVHGVATQQLDDMAWEALAAQGSIRRAIIGCQNRVYLLSCLRHPSKVEDLMDFLARRFPLLRPEAYVIDAPAPGPRRIDLSGRDLGGAKLRSADLQIIKAMREDGRKPICDIVEDTGLSKPTVRRRLSELIEHGTIEFDVSITAGQSNEVNFGLMTRFSSPAERDHYLIDMAGDDRSIYDEVYRFTNAPDTMWMNIWVGTIDDGNHRIEELTAREGASLIMYDVILKVRFFETWIDRL